MAYGEPREVRLWHDKREREMYDNFADLFAIIKTTEKLEKAYVRDVVSAKEYEPACTKLIAQFRTLKTALRDTVPDVEQFMKDYKMDCPAALNRLLVSGIPATVEHKSASSDSGTAAAVAECVQHFITAMDTLKLNMLAVDQVSRNYSFSLVLTTSISVLDSSSF
jgi:ESCRT-I complex subunit VPS28